MKWPAGLLILVGSAMAVLPHVDFRRRRSQQPSATSTEQRRQAMRIRGSRREVKPIKRRRANNNSPKNKSTARPTASPTTASPTASPSGLNCRLVAFKYVYSELLRSLVTFESANTDGASFPLYDPASGETIGVYHDVVQYFGDISNPSDCSFKASFSLDYNDMERQYDSQIVVQGTCKGDANPVIGGSGRYRCVKGMQFFFQEDDDGDSDTYLSEFQICEGVCEELTRR